jgi:hypothetical protein
MIAFDVPSPGELGLKLAAKPHLTRKVAVPLEMVTAALKIVGVPPLTGERISCLRREAGTRRQQTDKEKKGDFHPAAGRRT